MEIKEFQAYVSAFSREKGFGDTSIDERMLFLLSELGELADDLLKIKHSPIQEQNKLKKTLD